MTDNSIFTDKTVFYHSFGCKLNFAETSTVAAEFAGAGIRRVAPGEVPDIVVINTCSVTEVADKKCRQAIHSLHRRYPDAAIVVTGCYAQLKTDEVASLPGVAVVAGQDKKDRLLDFLGTWMETHQQQVDVPDFKDIETFIPSCARGRSRSGTIASMVEQARKAAAEGGREIVITGVNIGDFGRRTGETFADLVRALDEVEGIERYRISSIEPNLLTDEIIDFCAASKRFMPHFHVPLQCGSDEVLRLMRRRYDTALFRHKMEKIRQAMPDAFIGVDLIVGARGESDELFRESYEFCKSLDISRLHVFVYSERPGTRALELDGAVSPQAKRARSNRMLELSEEKLREFSGRFIGTVRPVLLEHTRPGHPMSGFTDNYLKVEVDAPARLDNTVVNVRLDRLSDDGSFIHATLLP